MHAWDIVGWTYHASMYCDDCGSELPDVDPEGNTRAPIFASSEAGDTPDTCEKCHAIIDSSWSGDTVAGAIGQLREYVESALNGKAQGNVDYLDACVDHLSWCGTDKHDDLVIALYSATREFDDE